MYEFADVIDMLKKSNAVVQLLFQKKKQGEEEEQEKEDSYHYSPHTMRANSVNSSPIPSPTHTKQVAALREQVQTLNGQIVEAEAASTKAGLRFDAMKGHLQIGTQ